MEGAQHHGIDAREHAVAAMPNANVRVATNAKPGLRRGWRRATAAS
jgi:hypothetical protein